MEELLKVNDISMVFGGLRAVSNFSMTINLTAQAKPQPLT